MNDLVENAFARLYPNKKLDYYPSINFSGRFKSYNANMRICGKRLEFNLSKSWKKINEEIVIGLIQSLLLKIFKDKRSTTNIDLYNLFIKKLHVSIPKTKSDPVLEESFNRVNEKYFYGLVEKPNLGWGSLSIRKLGSYDFQTDTITVSSVFRNSEIMLLDYIMYHELLHKKYKFTSKNNRSMHHTSKFKQKEAEFEDYKKAELRIRSLTSKLRRRSFLSSFSLKKAFF